MRLPIGHPHFVYRPHTPATRMRMSNAHRRRLGIPDGHCQIYGHHVPLKHADPLRYWAYAIARKEGRLAAEQFVGRRVATGYADIEWLRAQWLLKQGCSAVRELVRAVREAVAYAD